MTKYRRKLPTVEAITFDELVEYWILHAPTLHDGVPWSFNYAGFPVTHENDDLYLITTPQRTLRFNRGEMLIVDEKGALSTDLPGSFEERYERTSAKASREELVRAGVIS